MEIDLQEKLLKGVIEKKSFFAYCNTNLKADHFDEDKAPILEVVNDHYAQYGDLPEYSVIVTEIASKKKLSDDIKDDVELTIKKIKNLEFSVDKNESWLEKQAEQFVTDRDIFNVMKMGVVESGKEDGKRDYGKIKLEMEKALSKNWGHDYGLEYFDVDTIDEVYDVLGDVSIRIPTGVDCIDEAINGGIPGKTKFCAVFVGQAGLGKTMILGNTAVNAVKSGKNVLYISFEIDQRELRKRLDATFADLDLASIINMREQIKTKIKQANSEGKVGRLLIKEFPPASVSALDVENYLFDLKLKKDFEPDVLILDYLGIMKPISNEHMNSYDKGKAVCEEIRALSDKFKCPILSAVQSNRSGYGQSSVEMDNIADSMGIAHTCDLIISLAQTEELKENSQIKFEVIKSRISRNGAKGIVDVDYNRLRLLSNDEHENSSLSTVIDTGIKKIENKKVKMNASNNNNDIT